jgi:hypothetical protein
VPIIDKSDHPVHGFYHTAQCTSLIIPFTGLNLNSPWSDHSSPTLHTAKVISVQSRRSVSQFLLFLASPEQLPFENHFSLKIMEATVI